MVQESSRPLLILIYKKHLVEVTVVRAICEMQLYPNRDR